MIEVMFVISFTLKDSFNPFFDCIEVSKPLIIV